ncbi:PEP-CTERM sorting domain-containing protein [Mariniblastus fucicola]|uniref:PEP-CTERM protein-sorting domain-containing protein n=1 Tax=Mariniblastus fucicola TaxID=980251 RepID=A0A5B9P948_9BACT|nr:PEP-CTERM sorting domain-containing protein [Mariniblastus fucicola]QEG21755.1 hypothetical protein MFFC18_16140 [Mariniblastus fucicola]
MTDFFRASTLMMSLALFSVAICCTEQSSLAASPQLDGEHGEDGVSGDPGTDGEDGTDGSDIVESATDEIGFSVFGARGGNGGTGGDGIDGDDEGSSAQGGNGGNAGNGGDVHVSRSAPADPDTFFSTAVRGGHGGDGGGGGIGTGFELGGDGGSGGHGGRGIIDGEIGEYASFSARGGDGGDAIGVGAVAGDGGRSYVKSRFLSNFRYATINQNGGRGGAGFDGAEGGQGAGSTIGFNPDQFVFDPAGGGGGGDLNLNVNISGGRGGDSYNGTVGRGGTARLNLAPLAGGASSLGYTVNASIVAGQGGRGISTGNQDTDGATGAIALLNTDDQQLRTSSFFIRGGNGGSALGRQNQGDGGQGAAAIVNGAIRVAESNRFGRLSLTMYGGTGGHAQGTGWSGNGGSVIAPDMELHADGGDYLQVFLAGGDGGWGKRNGSGGDAIIQNQNAQLELGTEVKYLGTYEATAFGGNAGQGKNAVNAATGGNAVAELSQTGYSGINASTVAQGGFGNDGASGNATAKTFAHSLLDDRFDFDNSVTTSAVAATRRGSRGNWRPAYGTNSVAESTAINENEGRTNAVASAYGGWGFLQGGDAIATASSHSMVDGSDSFANAYTRGSGSTNSSDGNLSESTAVATSGLQASSQALANSERIGHNVTAKSLATATGDRIYSNSYASTRTSSWEHYASVRTGSTRSLSDQIVTVDTGSLVQFRSSDAIARPVLEGQMTAALLVNPISDQVAEFFEDESDFGDVFLGSEGSEVIGVGSVFASGVDETQLFSNAHIELDLEIQEEQSGGRFQIGFFGLDDDFGGFEEISVWGTLNGREFINEEWEGEDSATDAMSFFDDLLLDVADTPQNLEHIDLDFHLNFVSNDATDLFGLGFVFGNVEVDELETGLAVRAPSQRFSLGGITAVPEPSSIVVLMSLAVIAGFRRQRS